MTVYDRAVNVLSLDGLERANIRRVAVGMSGRRAAKAVVVNRSAPDERAYGP